MPEIGVEKPVEVPITTGKIVPKRQIDKTAEEIKAKRALPPVPGRSVDFDSMQSWLALFTDEMWKHVTIYVYRYDPVIDNTLAGDTDAPKYIDIIIGPFSKDYMISKHGGGKYSFYVTDNDIQKGPSILESTLSIPVTQYDPKIDIRTLDVNSKDNRKWVMFYRQRGELDKDNRPVDTAKTTPTISNNPAEAIANAMLAGMDRAAQIYRNAGDRQRSNDDGSGGLGKAIGDILIEKMRQEDPNKSMESFAKMASMFKSDNNTELFKMMLQMQTDSTNRMIDLLKEIKKPEAEGKEESDPLDKLDKLLEIGEKLGMKIGGRGGPRSGWDTALEAIQTLGAPTLNLVNNIIHMSMLSKQAAMGGVPSVPPVQPTPPPNNLIQMPTQNTNPNPEPKSNYAAMGANPNPETKAETVPVADPEILPNSNPQLIEIQATIRQVGGLVQKQILDGKKGWEFAESLVGMYGVAPHAAISKYGVEKVIEGMKSVPEFWNPIEQPFGEEYLTNWVGEFINYEEILERMEQGDDFDTDDDDDDGGNDPNLPIGAKKK